MWYTAVMRVYMQTRKYILIALAALAVISGITGCRSGGGDPDAGQIEQVYSFEDWDLTPVRRDGFTDYPVIIGEGTDYPLKGILSIPDELVGDGATPGTPAVVLVHGSGPINMDTEVYGITVFKDIAEHLAKNGVAVLRYDKRTFAHGAKLVEQFGDDLTVWEETIEDAIRAKMLLEQNELVDPNRIYVLGHSLGGMLAPRIVSEGGFAGGIIMAGSPRSLLEIIYDQNLYFIDLQRPSATRRLSLLAQVERARAANFTLPAKYIAEMDAHPAEGYLAGTDKPFLILQGGKDFQVYAATDFEMYKTIAGGRENIELHLYDDLTHLFTLSTMEKPTLEDYAAGAKVDGAPLRDIVDWLKK